MTEARVQRQVFTTSRLLEFCSQKELVLQTGHPVEQWPLVVLKELMDNALDACEEADVAPAIKVEVRDGSITVTDNGPGLAPETVDSLLEFSVRVSSREAYVSPTRGAQGNALKTLVAMPFALDGASGTTTIEARGVRHLIKFSVDNLRQTPRVDRSEEPSNVKTGTSITVHLASPKVAEARSRFLQIASDYTRLNPHLSLEIAWEADRWVIKAIDPAWRKWRPSDPTSAHWYDTERFERLIAAYVADDQDRGRARTIREFVSEFRGLSGSAKQRAVLVSTGMARMALADLFGGGEANHQAIAKLLSAMKGTTRPVKPQDLGPISEACFIKKFVEHHPDMRSFKYTKTLRDDDGIPAVVEIVFGYCANSQSRRIITGVNWSVGINDPFKNLGPYSQSLDGVLNRLYAGRQEPIVIIVHLACPRISYTDRGKGSLVLTGEITEKAEDARPPEPPPREHVPAPDPAKPLAADDNGILRIEPRGSLKVSDKYFEAAKQVLLK
jgi:DNA topoisomerase VI subunit B